MTLSKSNLKFKEIKKQKYHLVQLQAANERTEFGRLLYISNIIRPHSGRETFHWELIMKKTSLRCDSNLKLHNFKPFKLQFF